MTEFQTWICECGQETISKDPNGPTPLRWNDGHVCKFRSERN